MPVAFRRLLSWWRRRLAALEARRGAEGDRPWRDWIERRVLLFLLRRHDPGAGGERPQSAERLDAESAESARRLRLSGEARERLGPDPTGVTPHAAHGFRSEDELADLEAEAQRRENYRKRLARRSALMALFFLLFLVWLVSALIITRRTGYW